MKNHHSLVGKFIKSNQNQLAEEIFNHYLSERKKTKNQLKQQDQPLYFKGIIYNLSFLAESIMFSRKDMFSGALGWGKKYISKTHIPMEDVKGVLDSIKSVFEKKLPKNHMDIIENYLNNGIDSMEKSSAEIPSFIFKEKLLYKESKRYLNLLLDNNKASATKLIMDLVKRGTKIKDIYLKIFQPTQNELGRLWQKGDITVAQEHYSTAVTQLIMSQLYYYIFENKKGEHVFIGACAAGELHEIGLRMVSDLLEMEGWDTFYLGANVPPGSVLKTLIDNKAEVIGLSATMTFNVGKIEHIINTIRKNDECKDVKIIVGGYAFNSTAGLWKDVGADGSAVDAVKAISVINDIIS